MVQKPGEKALAKAAAIRKSHPGNLCAKHFTEECVLLPRCFVSVWQLNFSRKVLRIALGEAAKGLSQDYAVSVAMLP